MIKIIKDGKRYELRTTCESCGCEFIYENEDIIEEYPDNPYDYSKVVKCPCCKRNVDPSINLEFYARGRYITYYNCPICKEEYEDIFLEAADFPIQCKCGQLLMPFDKYE